MATPSWPRQCLATSGYLSIFIAPLLLVAGLRGDRPLLAFGAVMVLYPLARVVFGEVGEQPITWMEGASTFLHNLPRAYAACLPIAVFWLPLADRDAHSRDAHYLFSTGLSLWATLLLSTCVAHELIHRRSDADARLGRWLAAMAGYPLLGIEHLVHHLRTGDVRRAEWPAADESVWGFVARRQYLVLLAAIDLALGRRGSERARRALFESCGVTTLCMAVFAGSMGSSGATLYAATAVGVVFGFHAINYVQHWGLSGEQSDAGEPHTLAWEDSCRFQVWVTLNISCHQAHHRDARRPYYLLALERGSPRQPAGYLILLILSLVPPLWHRLMTPVLEAWRRDPTPAAPRGRRLTCFRQLSMARRHLA